MQVSIDIKQIIRSKKSGEELSREQINYWIENLYTDAVKDYQTSALLMAICFQGMNFKERAYLTQAMQKSGFNLNLSDLKSQGKLVVDKHASGGIGEKSSLILSPLLVELGFINPMISGRGLGHTGGTLDKLQSIPGYNIFLGEQEIYEQLNRIGHIIAGQTKTFVPADQKLYSLRDVTETVKEISLITSSILSKKFSEDIDCLVMDIKCGTSTFMTTKEQAMELATSIVGTCQEAGIKCNALLSRMDYPIGEMIGNTCEVMEVIQAMDGSDTEYIEIINQIQFSQTALGYVALDTKNIQSNKELLVFSIFTLAINLLINSGKMDSQEQAFLKIKSSWLEGKIMNNFEILVQNQAGNLQLFREKAEIINQNMQGMDSSNVFIYRSAGDCKIKSFDGVALGNFINGLGAGRITSTDQINDMVSAKMSAHINQILKQNDIILTIYHPDTYQIKPDQFQKILDSIFEFTSDLQWVDEKPLIYGIVFD